MESDVSSSPSKRQKPESSKGKEKMKQEVNESESNLCGICFEGNSIRGYIDSCEHFFCFVCIMEWSKVESRCPLCKQRFKNICRKPIAGVFPEERVVTVPVRNQVWHPLGNQTATEVADPYAEVKCIKCQTTSEDHLLLLCDLCDSAAHTFCVGLGHTVPEGDWYCEDCTKLRNEHSNSTVDASFQSSNFSTTITSNAVSQAPFTATEIDTDSEDSTSSITTPDAPRNVSILEIVRGPYSRNGNRSQRRASRNQDSSRVRDRDISSESTVDSSARTLSKPRIAHNRVRVYRENWDAIRNASLGFSSSLPKSGRKNGRKRARDISLDNARKPQSSSSMNHKQSNTEGDTSGGRKDCNPYDTDRAWKMLDIAKSVQRAHEFTGSKQQGSKLRQDKCHVSTRPTNSTSSDASMSPPKYLKPKDLVGNVVKKDGGHQSLEIAEQKLRSQTFEEGGYALGSSYNQQHQGGHPIQHANECTQSSNLGKQDVSKAVHSGSSTISTPGSKKSDYLGRIQLENAYMHHSVEIAQQMDKYQLFQESKGALGNSCFQKPSRISPSQSSDLSSAEPTLKMNEVAPCRKSDCSEKKFLQWSNGSSSNVFTTSPTESLSRASDLSYDRSDLCASSCSKERRLKEVESRRSSAKITVRKDEDAKGEVQSLVKLNLKLLGRDKRLGVDEFKEVARLATHTILAACGLEHKRASVRPFSDSICRHSDQTKQLPMSNLMPTSCRECFYGFVKEVVSSIMANEIAVSASSR